MGVQGGDDTVHTQTIDWLVVQQSHWLSKAGGENLITSLRRYAVMQAADAGLLTAPACSRLQLCRDVRPSCVHAHAAEGPLAALVRERAATPKTMPTRHTQPATSYQKSLISGFCCR